MDKFKLIKREYMGGGYWLVKPGGVELSSLEETSKGQYPSFYSPYKINTANGLPEVNDYFVLEGDYYVYENTISEVGWYGTNWVIYSLEEFNKKYV